MIADPCRQFKIVKHDHDGRGDLTQQFGDLKAVPDVEVVSGFVEQHVVGTLRHGPGDGYALQFSAGECGQSVRCTRRQPDCLKRRGHGGVESRAAGPQHALCCEAAQSHLVGDGK